jgi:hypothetical protein
MDELIVDSPEPRNLGYLRQAEAAVNRAARSNCNEVAAGFLRLAQCWSKLAATVGSTGADERRDAA